MNPGSLNIFCQLYETQNMHRTAESLYLSQQAISKCIRALETELGVKLFVRSNSGVTPTQAGDTLYQEAKIIQDQYSILRKKLDAVKNGRKAVTLACAYGTMYQIFPAIKAFESLNPDIVIRWKELPDIEVDKRLLQEQVDLAVNIKGKPSNYLTFSPLYQQKICLLVYEGHPLYDAEKIEFADLQNENIILEGEEFRIYSLFREYCKRADVYPNIIAETSEIGFCQHMAELGEGLAVTIDFVARQHNLVGVHAIPFAEPQFLWEVGLQIPVVSKLKKESTLFRDFLLRYFSSDNQ